ncbi:MAG: Do family serine endopeptidase [Phycisphaerae bacterium]|nr:Do family serine endopeptidase [Phycisphaerae bacterium]
MRTAHLSIISATSIGLFALTMQAPAWSAWSPAQPPAATADADIAHALALSKAFQKVASELTPSVVYITAKSGGEVVQPRRGRQPQMQDPMEELRRRFFGDMMPDQPRGPYRTPEQTSFGSGFVVSQDGFIVTNNHVVENATELKVTLSDQRNFTAKLVGRDPASDVAVIKIDASGLPAVKMGDSDSTQVGEIVLAIGNPFGLNQTVTSGIVSAKGRTLNGGAAPRRGGQPAAPQVMFEDFIQTDAAINPGNSGGPLVNLRGEVVGINTAIFTRSGGYMGIGFAIPANLARGVIDSLITTGKVERGWMGIGYQDLDDDTARALGLQPNAGVLVSNVIEGSPAEKAGLKIEDVITSIDGRPMNSGNTLRNTVAFAPPGKTIAIEFLRDGRKQKVDLTLARRDDGLAAAGDAAPAAGNPLGIAVETVTADNAERLGLDQARGVVVTAVDDGSAASRVLNTGDVILAVNNTPVRDARDFKDAVSKVDLKRGVRLRVITGGVPRIVTIIENR